MGKEKCELVGAFSFIVQIILGLLSFLVLIGKNKREISRFDIDSI